MRLRFPKSARLARASEFQRLRRDGTSFHGKFMVLSVLAQAGSGEQARIGIVTSRRVGGAVVRNRVRRKLREIVRLERPRLTPEIWLVLVARQRAAGAEYAELRAEWLTLAQRAAVLAAAL
jgi:ribonuclease P protein component